MDWNLKKDFSLPKKKTQNYQKAMNDRFIEKLWNTAIEEYKENIKTNIYFIDNNNIWLEGQKRSGIERKLKGHRFDTLYRICPKKLLQYVQSTYSINELPDKNHVYVCGKVSNHNILDNWALYSNFNFQYSSLSQALQRFIEENKNNLESFRFIMITGDGQYSSMITNAVKNYGISVHLWSWEDSTSFLYKNSILKKVCSAKFKLKYFQSSQDVGYIENRWKLHWSKIPKQYSITTSPPKDNIENVKKLFMCEKYFYYLTPDEKKLMIITDNQRSFQNIVYIAKMNKIEYYKYEY